MTSRYKSMLVCYIFGKRFLKKLRESINYWEVKDHCHYTGKYKRAAHSICNLNVNVHNEIPVVLHNGSNHGYNFIINESSNDFEGQFNVLEKIQKISFPSNRIRSHRY